MEKHTSHTKALPNMNAWALKCQDRDPHPLLAILRTHSVEEHVRHEEIIRCNIPSIASSRRVGTEDAADIYMKKKKKMKSSHK